MPAARDGGGGGARGAPSRAAEVTKPVV